MAKQTYHLKRLSDGKVFKKKLDESFVLEHMDILRRIVIDGVEYQRLVIEEIREEQGFYAGKRGGGRQMATWPMKSDALGIHPDQIPKATAHFARIGIPTDYTKDGRAIVTGPRHRKMLAEAMGLHDRNGGYGDPQYRPYGGSHGPIDFA